MSKVTIYRAHARLRETGSAKYKEIIPPKCPPYLSDSEFDELKKVCENERERGKPVSYEFIRGAISGKIISKHPQASISSGYIAKLVKRMGFSSQRVQWRSASQARDVMVI